MITIPLQPTGVNIIADDAKTADWYALWDELSLTKQQIGVTTATSTPIYAYLRNIGINAKTIIITSGVHGSEFIGPKILYQLAGLILNDANFSVIKSAYNFVFVPIVNIDGFDAMPRTYNNGNNVNINRNAGTEIEWNNCSDADKGASWNSEQETQAILTLVQTLSPSVFLDIHNTEPILNYGLSFAVPNGSISSYTRLSTLCNELHPGTNAPLYTGSPLLINGAEHRYQSIGIGIDWVPTGTGEVYQSSADMTIAVSMAANFLYSMTYLKDYISNPATAQMAISVLANKEIIQTPAEDIDAFVNYPILTTEAKFTLFKSMATENAKISVCDINGEVSKYLDGDAGNKGVWAKTSVDAYKKMKIYTGELVNKPNSDMFNTNIVSFGFNDTAGNESDRSSGQSIVAANMEARGVGANMGNSYRFNGNNSYITIPGGGDAISGTEKLTLLFRLSQDILASNDRIFYLNKGTNFLLVSINSTLGVIVYIGETANYAYLNSYSSIVTAGTPYTLSVVIDLAEPQADKVKIYIDGVNRAITNTMGSFPEVMPDFNGSDIMIGSSTSSFDGTIDECQVLPGIKVASDLFLYHSMFSNPSSFVCKVAPVITDCYSNGEVTVLSGSGFKPENVDPVCVVNGVTVDPLSITDTEITLNNSNGLIVIINSDGEYCVGDAPIPVLYQSLAIAIGIMV